MSQPTTPTPSPSPEVATALVAASVLDASPPDDRCGLVDVGAAFREALPMLEATAEKFANHAKKVRQAMAEMSPELCPEHAIPLEVDWDWTIGLTWKNQRLTPHYKECANCAADNAAAIVNDRWRKLGVPEMTRHATFDNFKVEDANPKFAEARRVALAKLRRQVKIGMGFVLMLGKFGTGKTHLASAAIREAGGGRFVTLADLIGELRQTYTDNTGQDDLVRKYREAKILVLDELTSEVKGTDVAPILYRILSYRHDKSMLTIITSNEELGAALDILGGKLKDRITQNYVVANFTWDSARKAA